MSRRSRNLLLGALALIVTVAVGGYLLVASTLSAGSLAGILNRTVGPATNGLYRVTIGSSEFALRSGSFRLQDVQLIADSSRLAELSQDGTHPAVRFGLAVDSLEIRGVQLLGLALRRDIVADSVVVGEARLTTIIDPGPMATAVAVEVVDTATDQAETTGPVAPLAPPAERLRDALANAPTLSIGRVAIEGAGLRVDTLAHDPAVPTNAEEIASSDIVGRIDLEFLRIHIDSDSTIEDAHRLYTEDIRLRISDVETRQIGGNVLRLGELTASSQEERVDLAGFSFASTATIAEFLGRPDVKEGDRVNLLVNALSIDGLGFSRYMAEAELYARGITVDGFRVDILSDKHKPSTPRAGRAPMPHDFFQGLRSLLTIEQITVRNGVVTYSERAADGDQPGTITFSEVNARISNISNDPRRMSEETPLVVEASTRANDTAAATVQWRIPVLSPAPTMTTRAQIAAFDPMALNPTLEPLLGVRIKSGFIDSVAYEIDYSPGRIRGEVDAYYTGLGVQLLDKNTRKRSLGQKIIGFVANSIAIRTNNPARPGQAPQRGIVDQAIAESDPFFKLIWIGLRDGMAEVAARIG